MLCTLHLYYTYIKLLFVPTVRPGSPIKDEFSSKDFKFVLVEKENAPVKKETEGRSMAKDTGKTFMSAGSLSLMGINHHHYYYVTPFTSLFTAIQDLCLCFRWLL